MSISRDLIVTIKGDMATLNEDVIVYEHDKGIDLFFELKDNKYKYSKHTNILAGIEEGIGIVTIVDPLGVEIQPFKSEIINGKVKFTVTSELTDELTEIGEYKLQFHVGDDKCCEYSIPPIKFTVKERLKGTKEIAMADTSKVGRSIVAENEVVLFTIEGKYIKNVWKSGDYITATKLNAIENALENSDTKLANKSDTTHNHDTIYAKKNDIPTKTSQLTNDSNFLTHHQDLSGYVEKEIGKVLSTNDYTTADKTKLNGLNNYVHPDNVNIRHVTDVEKSTWHAKFDSTKEFSELNTTNKSILGSINENKSEIDVVKTNVTNVTNVLIGYNKIYGVEVDFANNTFTRLLDAIGKSNIDFNNISPWKDMKRCNLKNGIVQCYHGEIGFIEDGSNGDVMVEIPKFYYKVIPLELEPIIDGIGHHIIKAQWLISEKELPSFKLHPAFIRGGIIKNYIYIGAYEASLFDVSNSIYVLDDAQVADFSTDKLASIVGAKPISGKTQNLNIQNARLLCVNKGNGYEQNDFTLISAIQLLQLIEYASFDTQTTIGQGITNMADDPNTENNSLNTGGTSVLGNQSGSEPSGIINKCSVSYRGIENMWGNIFKFVDGINIEAKNIHLGYWSNDNKRTDTNVNYNKIGFTICKSNGYVDRIGYDPNNDFVFLSSRTTGASNKPLNDYFYQNNVYNGWFIALLGGRWNNGSSAGAFFWGLYNGSGYRSRSIGTRFLFYEY